MNKYEQETSMQEMRQEAETSRQTLSKACSDYIDDLLVTNDLKPLLKLVKKIAFDKQLSDDEAESLIILLTPKIMRKIDINLVRETPHESRTCKVTAEDTSVIVSFPCNVREYCRTDYAACIANAVSCYMLHPTEEDYCNAYGESKACFDMAKSTYQNMSKLLTDEELDTFISVFVEYF